MSKETEPKESTQEINEKKAIISEVLVEISEVDLNDAFTSSNKSGDNKALKIWAKTLEIIKKNNELMLYNVCEDVSLVEYKNDELIIGLLHGGSFNMLNSFKGKLLEFIKEVTPVKSVIIKKVDEKTTEKESEVEKILKEKFKDKLIIIE